MCSSCCGSVASIWYDMAAASSPSIPSVVNGSGSGNGSGMQGMPPPLVRAASIPPILHYRLTDVKTALAIEPWITTDQLTPKPDDVCCYHATIHLCVSTHYNLHVRVWYGVRV